MDIDMKLDPLRIELICNAIGRASLDLALTDKEISKESINNTLEYFAFHSRDLDYVGILMDASKIIISGSLTAVNFTTNVYRCKPRGR